MDTLKAFMFGVAVGVALVKFKQTPNVQTFANLADKSYKAYQATK